MSEPATVDGPINLPLLIAGKTVENLQPGNCWDAMAEFAAGREQDLGGRVFRNWPTEMIRLAICYHAAKRTLIARMKGSRVLGFLCWYRFATPDFDMGDPWALDDRNGRNYFIAYCYAQNERVRIDGLRELLHCEPAITQSRIFTCRWKGGNDPHPRRVEYPAKRFFKQLLK